MLIPALRHAINLPSCSPPHEFRHLETAAQPHHMAHNLLD